MTFNLTIYCTPHHVGQMDNHHPAQNQNKFLVLHDLFMMEDQLLLCLISSLEVGQVDMSIHAVAIGNIFSPSRNEA